MEKQHRKSGILGELIMSCRKREIALLASTLVIILHMALRGNEQLMRTLSEQAVQPAHRFMSRLTAAVPFSVAEALILT